MDLSAHERFLRELRAPMQSYLRRKLQRKQENHSKAGNHAASSGGGKAALSENDEQELTLEQLLEKKYNELFGSQDEDE